MKRIHGVGTVLFLLGAYCFTDGLFDKYIKDGINKALEEELSNHQENEDLNKPSSCK